MTTKDALERNLFAVLSEVFGNNAWPLGLETPLMSGDEPIDSVSLVEICVRLEDYASEAGFEFDWTSENAMSSSRSVFATVGSLYQEFVRQMNVKPE